MMEKAHKIIVENKDEFAKLNNYLISAKKIVVNPDGSSYKKPVTLQAFLDDEGNIKMLREL